MNDDELKRLRALFAHSEERPVSRVRKLMRNVTLCFGDHGRKKAISERVDPGPKSGLKELGPKIMEDDLEKRIADLMARAALEKSGRKLRTLNDEIERLMDEQEKRKSSQGKPVRFTFRSALFIEAMRTGNPKRPRIHLNRVKASLVTHCAKRSYEIPPAENRRIIFHSRF